jgi:hypothetical protein
MLYGTRGAAPDLHLSPKMRGAIKLLCYLLMDAIRIYGILYHAFSNGGFLEKVQAH